MKHPITVKHISAWLIKCTSLYRNNGSLCATAFIDLNKPSNAVSHSVLLSKLSAFGFNGKYLKSMGSYLSKRWLMVRLNGDFSDERIIPDGVPQGDGVGVRTQFNFMLYQ